MDVISVGDLTAQVDRANTEKDPSARVQKLRDLRTDLAFLVGACDRYIADAELARESEAIQTVEGHLNARADADARDRLINVSAVSPEAADQAGVFSHAELDRMEQMNEAWVAEVLRESLAEQASPTTLRLPQTHELVEHEVEHDDGPNQPSTVDVFARTLDDGTRVYDRSREPLHRHVVEGLLADKRRSSQPVAFLIGGATDHDRCVWYLAEQQGKLHDVAIIDQQHIRRLLPEFSQMIRAGDPMAHPVVAEEAADIAGMAFQEAIRRGVNVAVTGTGAHRVADRADALREAGYRVEAHYTSGVPALSVQEAADQADDPAMPPEYRIRVDADGLVEAFQQVAEVLPGLAEHVNELHVYSTDGPSLKPVFRQIDGHPVVLDAGGWQEAIRPTMPGVTQ